MKIDIKSILILCLLGFGLIFFYRWYFSDSDGYKKEVDRLRKENQSIIKKRDSIDVHLVGLQNEFSRLKQTDSVLQIKLRGMESEVQYAKNKANISKLELDKLRVELESTRKQIEDLKNKPANRTDEDLLNSLKNKTKK